jgi:short-subunit dehydrogenase
VVVITGASSGIGEALALELAKKGAQVALLARRTDRLTRLVEAIRQGGGTAIAVPCDVTREEGLAAAASEVRDRLGPADCVVANAGNSMAGHFEFLKLSDYRRQLDTNLFGALATVQAFLADLKQTRGRIGLVGSVTSYLSLPGGSAYAMSKFALRAFSDALGPELSRYGISVTFIAPGFVATEIRKVDHHGRFDERNEDDVPTWLQMPSAKAARIIARALAARKREQIVTGHAHFFIWFARHAPWVWRTAIRLGLRRKRGRELSPD